MRSTTPMRVAKFGYVVISLLFCALGILMIVMPAVSPETFGIALGCAMVIFGAVKLVGTFPTTCSDWRFSTTLRRDC